MRTLFDLDLSGNTRGNFALNVARNAIRQAVILTYREINEERKLGGDVGGIDAYNEAVVADDLEAESNRVRDQQGHDPVITLPMQCAIASAAIDELEAVVEQLKGEADVNPETGEISTAALKAALYFNRTLLDEVKDVYDRNWGDPQAKTVGAKAIENEMAEYRMAYGEACSVEEATANIIARRKKIGIKYAEVLDEIYARIEQRATASRRVEARSFQTLYLAHLTREQNGRDVKQLIGMLKGSLQSFRRAGKDKGWNRQWMIDVCSGKESEIAKLEVLMLELANTTAAEKVNVKPVPTPATV
jgi:hypothetical protein